VFLRLGEITNMLMRQLARAVTITVIGAGLALAENGPPPGGRNAAPPSGEARGWHHDRGLRFILRMLDLTEEQKATAKTIFQGAYEQSEPLREELKTKRGLLCEAIKANNTPAIGSLAEEMGELRGELVEIHALAWAQFYALLTPEQKEKLEELWEFFRDLHPTSEDVATRARMPGQVSTSGPGSAL